ncbi:MAG: hypothetical protein FJ303_09495 [Planctomycetes bacterium]|nr:hypothetical protein [Planctomycetota bacterium]
MNGKFGHQPEKKLAEGVADILNDTLANLCIRASRDAGMADYFYLGIIRYHSIKDASQMDVNRVESALQGALQGEKLAPISRLALSPLRVKEVKKLAKDPMGREVTKTNRQQVWVEPHGEGNTPLAEALAMAADWVKGFIAGHPGCFPPQVINLTDGRPTTDPRPNAKALCDLRSSDGNVLFFNVHITDKALTTVEYPGTEAVLPQEEKTAKLARLLYGMSSILPEKYRVMAQAMGMTLPDQA